MNTKQLITLTQAQQEQINPVLEAIGEHINHKVKIHETANRIMEEYNDALKIRVRVADGYLIDIWSKTANRWITHVIKPMPKQKFLLDMMDNMVITNLKFIASVYNNFGKYLKMDIEEATAYAIVAHNKFNKKYANYEYIMNLYDDYVELQGDSDEMLEKVRLDHKREGINIKILNDIKKQSASVIVSIVNGNVESIEYNRELNNE